MLIVESLSCILALVVHSIQLQQFIQLCVALEVTYECEISVAPY